MACFRRLVGGVALVTIALMGSVGDAQQPAAAPQQPAATPQQPPPPDPASPSGADAQRPVFRAGINYVRVDVIVTDKTGNVVPDLQVSDFELTEDGKPQTVDTFKLIKLDGGASAGRDGPPRVIRSDSDEETEAAKDDVRLFAIFLDDYHVRKGASLGVREPLMNFLSSQLGPSDMIGLMYPLTPVSAIRMTRNHDVIGRAVQQFIGRKYEYQPRNEFEEQYARYPTEVVERIRNQVSLSALKSLIVHMGSLKEGRKALILVSEGYSNLPPPQLRDPNASLPGLGNPARGDANAGQGDINEERAAFFASADLQRDLRDVYDMANRNNVAIYAVDPRGLAVNEFDIDQGVGMQTDQNHLRSSIDTLRTLAENSDGRAIVNRNDLAGAMKQITRDSSAYYLIGYSSTQTPSDGKFHEIKVRLKQRAGLQVRSRKGYWALTAEDVAKAMAPPKPGPPRAVENALATVARPPRSQVVRTWIGTSRGEGGKTRVTFVWEPVAPSAAGQTPAGGRPDAPSRVSLTAVGPDGAPYFRGRMPTSIVSFDASPGRMQLRVSVEDADSQVLDTETRDLTIPDLTALKPALGTPQVLRARNARELQQLKTAQNVVPTAAREFSRTEKLLVLVPVYGPSATAPTLSVHVLNRAGQPMSELPVEPSASPAVQQIEVPLAGLSPGEYLLEIKVSGDGGDVTELVGLRVTG